MVKQAEKEATFILACHEVTNLPCSINSIDSEIVKLKGSPPVRDKSQKLRSSIPVR